MICENFYKFSYLEVMSLKALTWKVNLFLFNFVHYVAEKSKSSRIHISIQDTGKDFVERVEF